MLSARVQLNKPGDREWRECVCVCVCVCVYVCYQGIESGHHVC
jgi:hypothetical protein